MTLYRIPIVNGVGTVNNSTSNLALSTSQSGGYHANEAFAQVKWYESGTFEKMRVYVHSNSASTSTTIKIRKGGADGNQSITVAAGATGWFEDTSNTDAVTSGDLWNYKVTRGDAGSLTITAYVVDFVSANPVSKIGCHVYQSSSWGTGANQTYYPTLFAQTVTTATEANEKRRLPTAVTLKNLSINIDSNTRNQATLMYSRVNGADGAQLVTMTASTAGWFEDTTNTDSITAGDDVSIKTVTGNTSSGRVYVDTIAYDLVSSTAKMAMGARIPGSQSAGTTRYLRPIGGGAPESTEAAAQIKLRGTGTIRRFGALVWTNTASNTTTATMRLNGADTSLTFNVGGSSTGNFEDNSNSFTYADGDLITIKSVRASGTGAITFGFFYFELESDDEDGGGGGGSTFIPVIMIF